MKNISNNNKDLVEKIFIIFPVVFYVIYLFSSAGHITGGTASGLFKGASLNNAFGNSFDGLGQSMAIGTGIGVASTVGVSFANGINPLNGRPLVTKGNNLLRPLGLGSTGRTAATNLNEQLAMREAMSNPAAGRVIMEGLKDARWSGWSKMQYIHTGLDGVKTNIHYVGKFENGILKYVDDFKFK